MSPSPVLISCCFCPKIFTDKEKLVLHKNKEHGIHAKMAEISQLGFFTNFKVAVQDVGSAIMQECFVCGSSVLLSDFEKHQNTHTHKRRRTENSLKNQP